MSQHISALILLLCAVLMAMPVMAQQKPGEVVEWIGLEGGVNWTRGRVTADGIGGYAGSGHKPRSVSGSLACRAAMVVAQRNLVEIVKGVRVEGESVVENFILRSDRIRTTVDGALRGAVITSRQILPDGACRVTMEMPMSGPFAAGLYGALSRPPDDFAAWKPSLFRGINGVLDLLVNPAQAADYRAQQAQAAWTAYLQGLQQRLDRLERLWEQSDGNTLAQKKKRVRASMPTGLVIDARGTFFIPSMSPRLRREQGDIIYPNRRHHAAHRQGNLVSLFMNDLHLAQRHPRVGERPMVVKGLKTWGRYRTEIILGNEASEKLATWVGKGLLDHAPVIIVLD
ncbi:MAG: hypothetical protein HQL53_08105 [Magnetococcales bacterium]|nr:hypothetical protein [Magnetococcales bacterium]